MTPTQTRQLLIVSILAASLATCDSSGREPGKEIARGVRLLGRMSDPAIVESSGVAASRRFANVFWTHNDGGGAKPQVLHAIDREGRTLASVPVKGVAFHDWEDIAIDDSGHLYLADTGNNDAKRDSLTVYEINEPNPHAAPRSVSATRRWTLTFPKAPFDCEGLFIWKDHGYVVSKVFKDAHAQIYRFSLKTATAPVKLELVATTKIKSPVTGADISADGKLLGLVAKDGAYVTRIDGDVARAASTKPHYTSLKEQHIEGCCFVADGLLVTSENRSIFLFTNPAFRGQ